MLGLAVPELSAPRFSELAEFVIAEARRRSYTVVMALSVGACVVPVLAVQAGDHLRGSGGAAGTATALDR
jgi:hypothetical protein